MRSTPTSDCDTLEIQMIRLPERIDTSSMAQIMADLEAAIAPGIGVMLDFSQTTAIDRTCLKVFEFANELATERSATLGYMGESPHIRNLLEFNRFFQQESRIG
jgi:anti-anti-sigma regulatory factor